MTRLRTANVLFLDGVGYSRLDITQAKLFVQRLHNKCMEFLRKYEKGQDYFVANSGDGLAIIFINIDPTIPINIAKKFWSEFDPIHILQTNHTGGSRTLSLRIGINQGPVDVQHIDINDDIQSIGSGINKAQRVMDAGRSGQILFSEEYYNFLSQYDQSVTKFSRIGKYKVKDGIMNLYNYFDNIYGLPNDGHFIGHTMTIVSKRNDPSLLFLSEMAGFFEHFGFSVELLDYSQFVSIKDNIRNSSVVINILPNEQSTVHEIKDLLRYINRFKDLRCINLQIIGITDDKLASNSTVCKSGVYSWIPHFGDAATSDKINDIFFTALIHQITRKEQRQSAPVNVSAIGALSPNNSCYIERSADILVQSAIRENQSIIRVRGVRRIGKTSFISRIIHFCNENGFNSLYSNLESFSPTSFDSIDKLVSSLLEELNYEMNLQCKPSDIWIKEMSCYKNFANFINAKTSSKISPRLIWIIDGADKIFPATYAPEFFNIFKIWSIEQKICNFEVFPINFVLCHDENRSLERLRNINISDVAYDIKLDDFSLNEVANLNSKYGNPIKSKSGITALHREFGGIPDLTHYYLCEHQNNPNIRIDIHAEYPIFIQNAIQNILDKELLPASTSGIIKFIQGIPIHKEELIRLTDFGILREYPTNVFQFRCFAFEKYVQEFIRTTDNANT